MPLEQAQYINTLQSDWPLGSDPESAGDDHLRMIKQVLKNTFPGVEGAITPSEININQAVNAVRWREGMEGVGDNVAITTQDGSEYAMLFAQGTNDRKLLNQQASIVVTWDMLVNAIYPIGGVFESWSDSRNPADILGFGTWLQLVGHSVAVGDCKDGAGITNTYNAGFNGGVGTWTVPHACIQPGGYIISVSGTADEQGSHYHGNGIQNPDNYANGGGYYGTQPIANYGGGWAEGGSGTASESLTSTNGAHGHGVTASGTVTIGSGEEPLTLPFHTTYRWVRTA